MDTSTPCKHRAPPTDLPRAGGGRLAGIIDTLLLWLERGRQRRHLGRLSNYMLKDIGITRADVEAELTKRSWRG